jgi:cytochrome c oxidase subunit 3
MSAPGGGSGLSAAKLGMVLLLAALGMLFGSTIVGYLVVRSRASVWPPPGMPGLPAGLWISTLIILVSSASMEAARSSIRRGGSAGLRNGILITFLLGLAFLANQTACWLGPAAAQIAAKPNPYTFGFFVLTGLHAAHVIGGLIPLGIVSAGARKGRYSASSHAGVDFIAMYWHFLAIVWIILHAVLLITA